MQDYRINPPDPVPFIVLSVDITVDEEMFGEFGNFSSPESVRDYVLEVLSEKFKQEVNVEFVEVVS